MSVQKIIEYQKIDFNIYKIEKNFTQSAEKKRLGQLRDEVKNKMDSLDELMRELEKCYTLLNGLNAKLSAAEELKPETDVDFTKYEDLKEFEKFDKEIAKYEEAVTNVTKEISKIIKRISEIGDINTRVNEQITRLAEEFNTTKNVVEEKKKMLLRDMLPYAKQLKAMEPEIDADILEKYKEIRKKKMPVFVPFSDGSCLGCGINIALEVEKYLVNPFDYTECPHCGRLVYRMK